MEPIKQSEDELRYCIALLRTNGNRNVPTAAIALYLRTQAAGARRDERTEDAAAYTAAAAEWSRAAHGLARDALAHRLSRLLARHGQR